MTCAVDIYILESIFLYYVTCYVATPQHRAPDYYIQQFENLKYNAPVRFIHLYARHKIQIHHKRGHFCPRLNKLELFLFLFLFFLCFRFFHIISFFLLSFWLRFSLCLLRCLIHFLTNLLCFS